MHVPSFRKKYYVKFAGGKKSLVIVKRPFGGYALYGLIKPDSASNPADLSSMVTDLERQFGEVVQHGEIRESGSISRAAQKLLDELNIKI